MLTQIWRVLKRVFAYIGLMIAVVVLSGVAFRAYRQYRIEGQTHIDTSKGIADEGFALVGEIDQWVSIRGVDRNNPVLLLLHGGPGITTSGNPRTILHGWERQFTLVQWDQRGAGRTFGRSGPVGSDATIDTMVRDGLAVAEYARMKLQRQKIILVGLDHFRRLVNEVDLDSLGPEFTIPVFVFNGSQGNVAPTKSAETYLQSIRAPRKLFVPIEDAGHTAIFTKTETFLALLTQHVRPLAFER